MTEMTAQQRRHLHATIQNTDELRQMGFADLTPSLWNAVQGRLSEYITLMRLELKGASTLEDAPAILPATEEETTK